MLYWDTSALLPTLLVEKSTAAIQRFVASLPALQAYTAILTPIEVESAIQRRTNEKNISLREGDAARTLAVSFRKQVFLVPTEHNVLDQALHLQKIYGLRAGDAVQLASARVGTDNPARVQFICLDEKLREAAKREGFNVPELG